MSAKLSKLTQYYTVAEDKTVTQDSDFLTEYLYFLEDLTRLYTKGAANCPPAMLHKINEFVQKHVPLNIRQTHIDLYHYQAYTVFVVDEVVGGITSKDFKFQLTSTVSPLPQQNRDELITKVATDERLMRVLARTSVVDDLPIHSGKVRDALKNAYTENELKTIINRFRQKNPDAGDIGLSRYLATEIYQQTNLILDRYDFTPDEKKQVYGTLTETEVRKIVENFENAKQTSRTVSDIDLKRMLSDAIKAKRRGRMSGTSVIDTLDITQIDKDLLKSKFSENMLKSMAEEFTSKNPNPSRHELTEYFEKIIERLDEENIKHILTRVGKVKFEGEGDNAGDGEVYTDKMNRNTQSQGVDHRPIPPKIGLYSIPDTYEHRIDEPKDLYAPLNDFAEAGRVAFKVQEYSTWFLSEETAAWAGKKFDGARPLDNHVLPSQVKLPTIFQISVKNPDTMLIMAPHKLFWLLKNFNADFLKRNYAKQKQVLSEIRLAAIRLLRVFEQRGMYIAIVHHIDPYRKVVPVAAKPFDLNKAKLTLPPSSNSRNCLKLLEGFQKL